MQEVRTFLGHVGFYRRYIKNFVKIGTTLFNSKDMVLEFDEECKEAFDKLKKLLTCPSIIQPLD